MDNKYHNRNKKLFSILEEFKNNNLYSKQVRHPNDMYEKNYNI